MISYGQYQSYGHGKFTAFVLSHPITWWVGHILAGAIIGFVL